MFDKYTWFIIGGLSLVLTGFYTFIYFAGGIMMR